MATEPKTLRDITEKLETLERVDTELRAQGVVQSLAVEQLTRRILDNTRALQNLSSELEDLKVESRARLEGVESELINVKERIIRLESRMDAMHEFLRDELAIAVSEHLQRELAPAVSEHLQRELAPTIGLYLKENLGGFLKKEMGEVVRQVIREELDRNNDGESGNED